MCAKETSLLKADFKERMLYWLKFIHYNLYSWKKTGSYRTWHLLYQYYIKSSDQQGCIYNDSHELTILLSLFSLHVTLAPYFHNRELLVISPQKHWKRIDQRSIGFTLEHVYGLWCCFLMQQWSMPSIFMWSFLGGTFVSPKNSKQREGI